MSGPRKPHAVERRVSWMECDRSGRIRHQVVFDWVVDAEVALLREAGLLGDVYDRLPRVAVDAQYARPLQFDDMVTLELEVADIGGSSVRYAFRVRRDGEVCVHGSATVVYVEDGRAARLPDRLRAALESVRA